MTTETSNHEDWCYRCEDWEETRLTDCCNHRYPYCYLTIHPDGTTECDLCLNHHKDDDDICTICQAGFGSCAGHIAYHYDEEE